MITTNTFMKREFGKKLIEEYLPKLDLTHVIDTSRMGHTLAGHGTPTVILFGRNRKPTSDTVRAVLGINGEPTTTPDGTPGFVWQSILRQIDVANAQDDYTSTADVPRTTFATHPWSVGGGGAADLKEVIEEKCTVLSAHVELPIGRAVRIAEEEVFMFDAVRKGQSTASPDEFRGFLTGEKIRDWTSSFDWWVWYPYCEASKNSSIKQAIWPWRTTLANRSTFQGVMADAGLKWFDYMQHTPSAYRTPMSITFAFVATHNHFVLDLGGKVFKQSAPVIKLPSGAPEADHTALLGLLNSSPACFWMKQAFHDKGGGGIGGGLANELWEHFYEFTGMGLQRFPVPDGKPVSVAQQLNTLGQQCAQLLPDATVQVASPTAERLMNARKHADSIRGQMIALQEELDWQCYHLYSLLPDDLRCTDDDLPELVLGERAFEIIMARQMARGELQTTWFERHGSKPITDLPKHWPAAYRKLVERRIKLIETNKEIGLIERSEYKRRWNTEPWREQEQRALKNWLLDRLEDKRYWSRVELQTTAHLADRASADAEFLQVAALYRGRSDFDVAALVGELVEGEAVPFLPILRYKASGLRKREVWEPALST
jgi:hypothetical protein